MYEQIARDLAGNEDFLRMALIAVHRLLVVVLWRVGHIAYECRPGKSFERFTHSKVIIITARPRRAQTLFMYGCFRPNMQR